MALMEIVNNILGNLFPLLFLYVLYKIILRLGSGAVRDTRKAHNRAFKS